MYVLDLNEYYQWEGIELYEDDIVTNKCFRTHIGKLNTYENAIMFHLTWSIYDSRNVIVFDSEIPSTYKDIASELGISTPTLKKYLKILEGKDILRIVKKDKKINIYMNPYHIFMKSVDIDTWKLFYGKKN